MSIADAEVFLPCAGVLFDNDGVLVDSDASVAAAWTAWAHSYGLAADGALQLVHGRRTADTVAQFFGAGPDADAAHARINDLEMARAHDVVAVPGAVSLTRSIDWRCWAVVTSGLRALARERLRAAGLWPVPVLIGAEDVPTGKPAPDGFLCAARELGVAIESTVVVEDADSGVRAARAAGAGHVVGVGQRALGTQADVVVADLRGIAWTGGGLRLDRGHLLRLRGD